MRDLTDLADRAPTGDEQDFPPALSFSENEELLAWYAATEKLLTDPEFEDMWAEEQVWRERFEQQRKASTGEEAA